MNIGSIGAIAPYDFAAQQGARARQTETAAPTAAPADRPAATTPYRPATEAARAASAPVAVGDEADPQVKSQIARLTQAYGLGGTDGGGLSVMV